MKRALLIATLLVSACATAPHIDPVPVVKTEAKESVNIDPSLIVPCAKHLQKLQERAYSEADIVQQAKPWATQYDDCSARYAALIGIVVDAFNLKAQPSK